MIKRTIQTLFLLLAASSAAIAQHPGRRAHNEDLSFIHEKEFEQKAVELAQALALTAEQLATLRAVKASVEAVKAETEPSIQEAEAALESAAADIRANLESGTELSDQDRETLRSLKQELHAVLRDARERIREAAQGLEGLLTDEQKQIVAETLRPGMAERREGMRPRQRAEDGEGDTEHRGRGRHSGHGRRGPGGDRGKRAAAMVLLSDAFLNQFE